MPKSNFKPLLLSFSLLFVGVTHAQTTPAQNQQETQKEIMRDLKQEEANRQLVVNFYNQFFNQHETKNSTAVIADNYRQHNPEVPDGKIPFVGYFAQYFQQNPQYQSKIVRSSTDRDLVWLHVHSQNGEDDRGQAVVDIFRVENGKIVEHWDVIQDVPETSANDNTMF
ncbi:Predicted SnoaL-like aldol condensation-catalyzing enzyme [Acinetobacter marinus]|uniref:Predicted SnoaL-like aldol condensation-catalyzing enzyme n=1 Tax=Acinetobacter marinus TaxID=281375 RepID=A0A1G6H002_9GAMM|nr:nuclear transport factor 2 family protein [Acinetobacter marinus]SDB87494.1 Predicted SnoaL-like aldol condensation-catalyzing enzyme [Acinetobacter marinus]